ncbi:diguanylate cyclase domain-containing protein [Pseudomonas sp. NMS19W]|uniref:diguanylate cyclase domain-containing protein n=1 Tax=Pseudomonas sp. NMS19W TaxID=3079768 RepID=UPI003F658CC1
MAIETSSDALPNTEIEILAKRLLSVANANLIDDFPDTQIGVSIGIAEFPRDGKDANSLILAADSAMLNAKSLGKSRFQWAILP